MPGAMGSVLVRADEVRERRSLGGASSPAGGATLRVCLDIAAIDPSVAPGVEMPAFGGLTYFEVIEPRAGYRGARPSRGASL